MLIVAAFKNSRTGLSKSRGRNVAFRQELWGFHHVSLPAAALLADDFQNYALLVGAVLVALSVELLNTALEKLCDYVQPHHDPRIGAIKEMGSAAVLCALAFTAFLWTGALFQALVRLLGLITSHHLWAASLALKQPTVHVAPGRGPTSRKRPAAGTGRTRSCAWLASAAQLRRGDVAHR